MLKIKHVFQISLKSHVLFNQSNKICDYQNLLGEAVHIKYITLVISYEFFLWFFGHYL